MSDPIVAFRPNFPWTVAVATTNGDVIIRHLPTSQYRLTNECIVVFGTGVNSMIKILRWSEKGDFLQADDILLSFKLDSICSFLGAQHMCRPDSSNGIIKGHLDKNDILHIVPCATPLNILAAPRCTQNKIVSLCAIAPLCSQFSTDVIAQMADLLLHLELKSNHSFY